MKLNLSLAKEILKAGEEQSQKLEKDFVLAIVNSEGNLIIHERMDDAIFASIDISIGKAYTAVALKMDTDELASLSQPNEPLYGIHNNPKYIIFGGGIPLEVDGEIVGAIGVSGGSVEEDISVAEACVSKFNELC